MSLQELKRNRSVGAQLQKIIDSGRISHAFLFSGGTKSDRDEIGTAFAEALLERREDYLELSRPEDRASIGTAQITELQKKFMLTPYGAYYVALIRDAEFLTDEAQNKLLKTLEEPENAILILLSERREAMLPTVLSRCQSFSLEEPLAKPDAELNAAAQKLADAFSSDLPYYMCREILDGVLSKKEDVRVRAADFLDLLIDRLLDSVRQGNSELIFAAKAAQTARKYIRQGHNVAYTLKQMCLIVQTRR